MDYLCTSSYDETTDIEAFKETSNLIVTQRFVRLKPTQL